MYKFMRYMSQTRAIDHDMQVYHKAMEAMRTYVRPPSLLALVKQYERQALTFLASSVIHAFGCPQYLSPSLPDIF